MAELKTKVQEQRGRLERWKKQGQALEQAFGAFVQEED